MGRQSYMKYVIAICVVLITFLAFKFAYTAEVPQDNTRSIIVSKDCTLNEVTPGEDYIFDCPAK
jgi:hypothetical protein